jgi:hypothetical protein
MLALSSSREAIWLSKRAGSWIRPTIAAKESWEEAQRSRSWEHLSLQEDVSYGDVPMLLDSVECHCNVAIIG